MHTQTDINKTTCSCALYRCAVCSSACSRPFVHQPARLLVHQPGHSTLSTPLPFVHQPGRSEHAKSLPLSLHPSLPPPLALARSPSLRFSSLHLSHIPWCQLATCQHSRLSCSRLSWRLSSTLHWITERPRLTHRWITEWPRLTQSAPCALLDSSTLQRNLHPGPTPLCVPLPTELASH